MSFFGSEFAGKLGSDRFIRLKEGDSVDCVLLGKPRLSQVIWYDGKGYECSSDGEAKPRIAANAYIPTDRKVMILEGPSSLGRGLMEAKITADEQLVRISRSGTARNTRFVVTILRALSEAERSKVSQQELHDLDELWGGPDPQVDSSTADFGVNASKVPDSFGDDNIPF